MIHVDGALRMATPGNPLKEEVAMTFRFTADPVVTGYPATMGDDVQLNTTTLIRHAARTHAAAI